MFRSVCNIIYFCIISSILSQPNGNEFGRKVRETLRDVHVCVKKVVSVNTIFIAVILCRNIWETKLSNEKLVKLWHTTMNCSYIGLVFNFFTKNNVYFFNCVRNCDYIEVECFQLFRRNVWKWNNSTEIKWFFIIWAASEWLNLAKWTLRLLWRRHSMWNGMDRNWNIWLCNYQFYSVCRDAIIATCLL